MAQSLKQQLKFGFLTVALVALLAAPVMAAPTDVVDVEFGAGSVIFNPQLAQAGYLTVSGPDGFRFEERFEAGGSVSFSPLKEDGGLVASGVYKWQLYYVSERGEEAENLRGLGKATQAESAYGTLRIRNGNLVNPNVQEELPRKDQVFNDDVIMTFSLCVGNDCVNGESFGFDTLRLKENNLRIHFEDTSTSASFPSNDWRIVVNDSSNGGANYFAVEDSTAGRIPFRVEAGAPVNTLYVEADGDVGVKTANPVVDVHVVEGNTPTLRLEQDGSDGFTPQTWDVAGNEANFFIRDVTNGSKLSFRIEPSAPESSLHIEPNGDIGVGTSAAAADLHVRRTDTGGAALLVEATNASGAASLTVDATGATGTANLTVKQMQDASHGIRLENGGQAWVIQNNISSASVNGGGLSFTRAGSGGQEMQLKTNGDLEITGSLITTGGGGACTFADPCDGVFYPGFEIESIDEHARYMWANYHLPAVGPTSGDEPFNLTIKTTRMLNELEKAHIYIEQLHARLAEVEKILAEQAEE